MDDWEFDAEACCQSMAEEIRWEYERMMQERREECMSDYIK